MHLLQRKRRGVRLICGAIQGGPKTRLRGVSMGKRFSLQRAMG